MKKVTIYTDGACSGNPGPGGYAGILMYQGIEKVVSGGEISTTNNRMEILAVIESLKKLKEPCEVDLYSDSQYVVDAFLKDWITNWQNNNWKTANKSLVKNVDLWEELLSLTKKHKVNFIKVKGHADNEFNNRCDEIARNEIKKFANID
jgi:ribonuclease HI